jgi:Nucleotide-diphospho-sugar transferase
MFMDKLFVYALCTFEKNHLAVNASLATWRTAPTFISTSAPSFELESHSLAVVWHEVDDPEHGWQGRGGTRAESRCTNTVRNAFEQFPNQRFVVSGDDDVVWIEENLRRLLDHIDENIPLHITDGFLDGKWLACESVFASQCKTEPFKLGRMQPGTVYNTTHADMWAYGNYGAIWSRGLYKAITRDQFDACAHCNSSSFTCMFGYDVRLGECAWAFGDTAPTLPHGGRRIFGVQYDTYMQHLRDANSNLCDADCEFMIRSTVSLALPKNLFQNPQLYLTSVKELQIALAKAQPSVFSYNAAANAKRLTDRPDDFVVNYDACAKDSKFYGPFKGNGSPVSDKVSSNSHSRIMFDIIRPMYDPALPSRPQFDDRTSKSLQKEAYAILLAFNNEKAHISKGYFYLVDQWFKHMRRVHLDRYVIFSASSLEECQLVQHMAPCIVHDATQSDFRYDKKCEKCFPLAADFRWLYVNALLDAGKELLILSDADAFFLKDPIPYFLDSDNAVFGLTDKDKDSKSDLLYCQVGRRCISTGFVAMKRTVSARVGDFVKLLHEDGGWEQERFNHFFLQSDVEELPQYSSTYAFANLKTVVDIIRAENGNLNLALVHAGGTSGDDKVVTYQCSQLWI